MIPKKQALITGLVIFAVGIFIYNKVPAVRKALGGV